jgi:hypothetical protein
LRAQNDFFADLTKTGFDFDPFLEKIGVLWDFSFAKSSQKA